MAKPKIELECDRESTLFTTVRALLIEATKTESVDTLARRADVPYEWLRLLISGRTTTASVNRVQHLYEFLTQKNLKV